MLDTRPTRSGGAENEYRNHRVAVVVRSLQHRVGGYWIPALGRQMNPAAFCRDDTQRRAGRERASFGSGLAFGQLEEIFGKPNIGSFAHMSRHLKRSTMCLPGLSWQRIAQRRVHASQRRVALRQNARRGPAPTFRCCRWLCSEISSRLNSLPLPRPRPDYTSHASRLVHWRLRCREGTLHGGGPRDGAQPRHARRQVRPR